MFIAALLSLKLAYIAHACFITKSCLTLCNPMCCSPPGSSAMEFSRHEYWSGLPFPSPRDLPEPGTEPASPASTGGFFTAEPPAKPRSCIGKCQNMEANQMSFSR